jgi:hypothetical protein
MAALASMRPDCVGQPLKQGRLSWVTLPLILGYLASACYHHVPVATNALREGEQVRVRLIASGAEELTRYVGPRVAMVEGRLVRASADSGLTLAVSELYTSDRIRTPWQGDMPLPIPASAVASVERRQLSRRRTILASAVAATSLVVLGVVAVQRGGRQSPDGPPPPPPPP